MKVLIAYDGSACANAAVEDLQRAGLGRENEVLVITAAHDIKRTDPSEFANLWKDSIKEAEGIAEKARARVQEQSPGSNVIAEALWGAPAEAVLKTIDRWKPDLLVVGSHGRSTVGRLFLGSVSLALVHHAPCSVRVVRTGAEVPSGSPKLLIATDGSAPADAVIREVAKRRWPEGTEARVVAVVETLTPSLPDLIPPLESNTFATEPAFQVIYAADERQRARLRGVVDAAAGILQEAGLKVNATVLEGDPRLMLIAEAEAWKANTIFIGARGLGLLDRLLLGSVSSTVVTHAHCSVEVVRTT